MNALVGDVQQELSRQLVSAWERTERENPGGQASVALGVVRLSMTEAHAQAEGDKALARAIDFFDRADPPADYQWSSWDGTARRYYYARPEYTASPPNSRR